MIDHHVPSHPVSAAHDPAGRAVSLGSHGRHLPAPLQGFAVSGTARWKSSTHRGDRGVTADHPTGSTRAISFDLPCTVPVVVVVTGKLQKEAWDNKVLPPVEQVRPGLWSIPVPIPDNPLRYVLVYGLELDGGGMALVDAGWDTDEAWLALGDGLSAAGGSIFDVRAVLVTHIHPDHYGLAGRVREASGAWIGLHPDDAVMLEARYGDTDELLSDMSHLLAESGVPADRLPDLAFASMVLKSMVTMAVPDVLEQ